MTRNSAYPIEEELAQNIPWLFTRMRHKTILKRKRYSGVTFLEDEAAYMLSRDKAKHAWYLDPSSLFVSRRNEIEIIFCDGESSREKVAARSVVCVHSCMHVDVFLPSWPLIERLESGLLPHIGIFSSALTSKRLVIPNQFMVMVGYRLCAAYGSWLTF